MKLSIQKSEFDQLPILNRLFLALWKQKKGYGASKEMSFGELVELSLAITNDLVFDTPLERSTFNNSLQYEEFNLSWDGNEPIDILNYEVNKKLNKRILNYMSANIK